MKTYRNALITFGLGIASIVMLYLTYLLPVIYRIPFPLQLVYLLPPLAAIVMGFVTFFTNKEEPFTGKVRLFLYSGLILGFLSLSLTIFLLYMYMSLYRIRPY
ncbi:MAG: hypothetical protein IMW89_10025 [Ktedonobacteraceae bacterium]|nr:hypothetical protein [Ktedonobacteraceae bacterium]